MKAKIEKSCLQAGAALKALLALLNRFNLAPGTFHALNSGSYEKQTARQSLAALEGVYCLLLQPGWSVQDAQAKCPPWPRGTANAGELPSLRLLRLIRARLIRSSRHDPVTQKELREQKRLAALERVEKRRRAEVRLRQQKQTRAAAPPPPIKNVFGGLKKTNAFLEKVYGLKFD